MARVYRVVDERLLVAYRVNMVVGLVNAIVLLISLS